MTTQSEEIIGFMKNPASYPDRPSSVRVIETHISWVFLSGQYAYKLKKPVRFEFLDFSSVALRRDACQEELRLNRHLAPSVYIDVVPITHNDNGFHLGGDGDVIDWVVKMHRLLDEIALDAKIRNGSITAEQEAEVAHFVASFYAQLQPKSISSDSYRQSLERHIRANRTAITSALPDIQQRIRRIHSLQLRHLSVEQATMDERVAAGRVVEGHGDLRPEHIYLETPPVIIDCIEFSKELRQVDVADELSFLDMECLRLGNASLGQKVLATYKQECRDQIPPRLLDFYRSYRACVRAKVALLRHQQVATTSNEAVGTLEMQYLDLAERFADKLGPPCVLIVGGLIGTGKSTVARTIADALGAELLSTDAIRRSQLGASQSPTAYGEGNYRPELRAQIYDALISQADSLLNDKMSVILDGTFIARNHRRQVYDLAARHGAVCLFVLCECNRHTALSRIQERSRIGESESEARAEFYDQQLQEFEPPGADENPNEGEKRERRAARLVGASLLILAAYVVFEAVKTLMGINRPEPSIAALVIAVLSLVVMPTLFFLKRRIAQRIGSQSLITDSKQTLACMLLSVALLLGAGMNYAVGIWQADPIAGLLIAVYLAREGWEILADKETYMF